MKKNKQILPVKISQNRMGIYPMPHQQVFFSSLLTYAVYISAYSDSVILVRTRYKLCET